LAACLGRDPLGVAGCGQARSDIKELMDAVTVRQPGDRVGQEQPRCQRLNAQMLVTYV
jgi:hypothetical protein